jgi:hypothetical protein
VHFEFNANVARAGKCTEVHCFAAGLLHLLLHHKTTTNSGPGELSAQDQISRTRSPQATVGALPQAVSGQCPRNEKSNRLTPRARTEARWVVCGGQCCKDVPAARFSDGVWVDNQFQLYAAVDGQIRAWVVSPQSTALDHSIPAPVPDGWFEPAVMTLGKHIAAYEPHARWFLSGANSAGVGGVRVVDPATGRLAGSLAASLRFAEVKASSDGSRFYGLEAGEGPQPAVRLLALDARNGSILAERPLVEDVWSISVARVPVELVPHGEVRPLPCEHAEPAPYPPPPPVHHRPRAPLTVNLRLWTRSNLQAL